MDDRHRRSRRLVRRTAAWLAIAGVAFGGCGPLAAPTPAASRVAGTPSAASSSAPTASAASASPPAAGQVVDAGSIRLTARVVVGGLSSPVLVTNAGDGSGRLFVVEQAGRIRVVRDGRLLDRPFLDVADRISAGGERGLLGLAFHPGFPVDPRFFVDYTDRDGTTVVSSFTVPSGGSSDAADASSERVLLRIAQPYPNHNGGNLAFGSDGQLYVGTGDGGSGGDPQGNGQRLDTLLGKLLRIDVDHPSGGRTYGIPADNPFVAGGGRPEIWAYGLRNPWRFSFDRTTGDLWIGDVGQDAWEEIDHTARGVSAPVDYGWNRMEGLHCFAPSAGCDTSGLTLPLAEYGHDQGCAVTGGYVARGAAAGALAGVYVFGDYCSGRIWGLASNGPARQEPVLLLESGRSISSFGEDEAGEILLTDLASGEVVGLAAGG
jgi:glucose/arabinose dehydrogenase